VFEIKFVNGSYASTPTTLTALAGAADGKIPYGGLVMDANGDLFGTTTGGSAGGATGGPGSSAATGGTVFEIKATNGTYASTPTTLYTFTGGSDGSTPISSSSWMPPATCSGPPPVSTAETATAFEIKATNGSYASTPTILGSFTSSFGGADAISGGLVMDAAGDLFGVTSVDGTGLRDQEYERQLFVTHRPRDRCAK